MSELEKMRRGELADMSSPELQDSFIHAKRVTIGNRCVIGAGSVVTKNMPDDSVVAGNRP